MISQGTFLADGHVRNLPSPSSIARNPVHLGNQSGQEAVERTSTNATAEEHDVASQKLISSIVRADEVGGTWHECGLGHTFK